jgi:RNA polymerase sigma-70 factor (ECF subfamily)
MGLRPPGRRDERPEENDSPTPPRPAAGRRFRLVAPEEGQNPSGPIDPLPEELVSDDALIAALAAGEGAALGSLYDRHARVIFALLVRIVADRDVAEDLLQEVFFRAWQHAHDFDEARGTVPCWLYGIAHNLAFNELRRRQRRPRLTSNVASHASDNPDIFGIYVDPTSDPAGDAWCAVRNAKISEALAGLPPAQRQVLALYAAGFSQSEIAAHLGEPLGTIKSRMRRALCHLRETLPSVGVDAGWPVD